VESSARYEDDRLAAKLFQRGRFDVSPVRQPGQFRGKAHERSCQDVGEDEIDQAGAEFQERWEHGIGKIAEFTESIAGALGQVKEVYMAVDDLVAQEFGGGEAGGGSAVRDALG
jgi:hypothetical protein